MFATFIILPDKALAQSMSNPDYKIDLSPLDTSIKESKDNTTYQTNTELLNEKASSRIIKGNNYTISLSYEDENLQEPFIASSSTDQLNFGEIDAGEPIIRSHSVSVTIGSAHGFQVLSQEDHNLQSDNKEEIPNTSCDSGSCTQILSDVWENPLTYGFGYRCQDILDKQCAQGFENNYYKRFANISFNESPAQIIYQGGRKNAESILLYKINISAGQARNKYHNSISYLFVPNL